MKNYSISIEHKDEAIRLFEKLGYMEDTEWNKVSKDWENTHILTFADGAWELHSHEGTDNQTPITIEELRELVNQTLTPQNAHKE